MRYDAPITTLELHPVASVVQAAEKHGMFVEVEVTEEVNNCCCGSQPHAGSRICVHVCSRGPDPTQMQVNRTLFTGLALLSLVPQSLKDFYQMYDPSKVDEVGSILEKYTDKLALLMGRLRKKYNAGTVVHLVLCRSDCL